MNYKKLKEIDEKILPFLRKLYFHHKSQAKPHTEKCSAKYHKEVARELEKTGQSLKKLLGES